MGVCDSKLKKQAKQQIEHDNKHDNNNNNNNNNTNLVHPVDKLDGASTRMHTIVVAAPNSILQNINSNQHNLNHTQSSSPQTTLNTIQKTNTTSMIEPPQHQHHTQVNVNNRSNNNTFNFALPSHDRDRDARDVIEQNPNHDYYRRQPLSMIVSSPSSYMLNNNYDTIEINQNNIDNNNNNNQEHIFPITPHDNKDYNEPNNNILLINDNVIMSSPTDNNNNNNNNNNNQTHHNQQVNNNDKNNNSYLSLASAQLPSSTAISDLLISSPINHNDSVNSNAEQYNHIMSPQSMMDPADTILSPTFHDDEQQQPQHTTITTLTTTTTIIPAQTQSMSASTLPTTINTPAPIQPSLSQHRLQYTQSVRKQSFLSRSVNRTDADDHDNSPHQQHNQHKRQISVTRFDDHGAQDILPHTPMSQPCAYNNPEEQLSFDNNHHSNNHHNTHHIHHNNNNSVTIHSSIHMNQQDHLNSSQHPLQHFNTTPIIQLKSQQQQQIIELSHQLQHHSTSKLHVHRQHSQQSRDSSRNHSRKPSFIKFKSNDYINNPVINHNNHHNHSHLSSHDSKDIDDHEDPNHLHAAAAESSKLHSYNQHNHGLHSRVNSRLNSHIHSHKNSFSFSNNKSSRFSMNNSQFSVYNSILYPELEAIPPVHVPFIPTPIALRDLTSAEKEILSDQSHHWCQPHLVQFHYEDFWNHYCQNAKSFNKRALTRLVVDCIDFYICSYHSRVREEVEQMKNINQEEKEKKIVELVNADLPHLLPGANRAAWIMNIVHAFMSMLAVIDNGGHVEISRANFRVKYKAAYNKFFDISTRDKSSSCCIA